MLSSTQDIPIPTEMDSVIAPVFVRKSGPFPHVRNLRPAFLVRSQEGAAVDQLAMLELPGDVPRLLPLPGGLRFVPLEDVIRAIEERWKSLRNGE